MKKLFVLIFGVALTAVSCTKDYTCTCKSTETGDTDVDTDIVTYKGVTKSFVKNSEECVSFESKDEKGAVDYKRECTID
jgi:hypothetical protein